MKQKALLLFGLYSFLVFSQTNDYTKYHTLINKAEELYFMEHKTDSTLFYYNQVFKEYNFIYVKDLVNAAQIALFEKRPYRFYIEKGFEQGLKIAHLNYYPLFKKELQKLQKDTKLIKTYNQNRKKYIARIDFDYRNTIYYLAIKDQLNKQKPKYHNIVYQTTQKLLKYIKNKGFPGDKLIGIEDNSIFREIGKSYLDLYQQRKKHKELFHMNSEEESLSTVWAQIILVHNPCSYYLLKKTLLNEIKKGNIHPRDVGLIYDNAYRYKSEFPYYCDKIKLTGAYLLNPAALGHIKNINLDTVNAMRKKMLIVSTMVDAKKKDYEIKYGFKLFSGFWDCR
jgi:hypothetical protein